VDARVGPVGQADPFVIPRFGDPLSFARLPRIDEVGKCDIAVLGVPFDLGVGYRPGARFGPQGIRLGSKLLREYNPHVDLAPFASVQVADAGDVACNPFSIEAALEAIEAAARGLEARCRHIVALGGDNTVVLPLLRAAKARFGELALVHFDSHLDTSDTSWEAPFNHGTPYRRAAEEGLLTPNACIHIGIHGPVWDKTNLFDDAALGFEILDAEAIDRIGVNGIQEKIVETVGERPVYVSVDIDVLDPAFAPGTGTPEPGGLTSRELLALIRSLAGLNVVAGDIVEVAPAYDQSETTALAAAHIAYELICLLAGRMVGTGDEAVVE
jgi:agmatinase